MLTTWLFVTLLYSAPTPAPAFEPPYPVYRIPPSVEVISLPLTVTIGPDGKVLDARPALPRQTWNAHLYTQAIQAVCQWVFKPALDDRNRPFTCVTTVYVRYRIDLDDPLNPIPPPIRRSSEDQ